MHAPGTHLFPFTPCNCAELILKLECSLSRWGLQSKQPKVKVYHENILHAVYDLLLFTACCC
jgi:hypothetical protein